MHVIDRLLISHKPLKNAISAAVLLRICLSNSSYKAKVFRAADAIYIYFVEIILLQVWSFAGFYNTVEAWWDDLHVDQSAETRKC